MFVYNPKGQWELTYAWWSIVTTYNNTEAVALNQVIKILRANKIQKLIGSRDSTIIICKIRDLTPSTP